MKKESNSSKQVDITEQKLETDQVIQGGSSRQSSIAFEDNDEDLLGMIHELRCPVCYENYNLSKRTPMMLCQNQHTVCLECLVKNLDSLKAQCPLGREKLAERLVKKNKNLCLMIENVAKSRNIKLKILENPESMLQWHGIANSRLSIFGMDDQMDQPNMQILINQHDFLRQFLEQRNNDLLNTHESCFTKFMRKSRFQQKPYCLTYLSALLLCLPFFIYQFVAVYSFPGQRCLDSSVQGSQSTRYQLTVMAYIGLSAFILVWFSFILHLFTKDYDFHNRKIVLMSTGVFLIVPVRGILGIIFYQNFLFNTTDEIKDTCEAGFESFVYVSFSLCVLLSALTLCSIIYVVVQLTKAKIRRRRNFRQFERHMNEPRRFYAHSIVD